MLKIMLNIILDTDILDTNSDDLSICKEFFVNKYIKYYMNRNVIAESSYLSQDYAIIATNDGEIIELFIT